MSSAETESQIERARSSVSREGYFAGIFWRQYAFGIGILGTILVASYFVR